MVSVVSPLLVVKRSKQYAYAGFHSTQKMLSWASVIGNQKHQLQTMELIDLRFPFFSCIILRLQVLLSPSLCVFVLCFLDPRLELMPSSPFYGGPFLITRL